MTHKTLQKKKKKTHQSYRGNRKRDSYYLKNMGEILITFLNWCFSPWVSVQGLKFWKENTDFLARRLKRGTLSAREYWENIDIERENTLILCLSWQEAPFSLQAVYAQNTPRKHSKHVCRRSELWCKVLPKSYLSFRWCIPRDSHKQHGKSFQTKQIL